LRRPDATFPQQALAGYAVRTKKIDRDQPVQSARREKPKPQPDPSVLLAWYDQHRRALPWRAQPGERADPYRVWLAEIMLQQTTVKTVGPYYARFLARWPTLEALAAAPLDDVLKTWAGLGYYARARNLHACARAVLECHAGRFPDNEQELRTLPGIGLYTAAAIAAIAFDARTTPVDGNVERVIARLFAVERELPAAKPCIRERAAQMTPGRRTGDFAQALMDLGATVCTPKRPACTACPWVNACAARRRGDPETFPVKAVKPKGRLRRGAAFVVARADAAVLLRTRPATGLLGGMTEVPTTPWTHEFDQGSALDHAPSLNVPRRKPPITWRPLAGIVTHVFTHFPLELKVYTAQVPLDTAAPAGMRFVPASGLAEEALPNLMRKVLAHAGKV
jgi:A/G-specific adenine glycosylase